ncbi:MAG: nucleotidyl transferase AbiEii/AbiGii toxin family protein [Leptospirales bacterium]
MENIARSLSDTPLILKGGTALLLAYGLDRYSEDLDFDSNKHLRLENRIEKSTGPLVKIDSVDVPKNTDTVQRYRVAYSTRGVSGFLKIEVSCRDSYDSSRSHFHKGIRVYDLPVLIDHKLETFQNRTASRDLYDLHFLLTRKPQMFSLGQTQSLVEVTRDIDALERRYAESFKQDPILQDVDLSRLVLSLYEVSRHLHSGLHKDSDIAKGSVSTEKNQSKERNGMGF